MFWPKYSSGSLFFLDFFGFFFLGGGGGGGGMRSAVAQLIECLTRDQRGLLVKDSPLAESM